MNLHEALKAKLEEIERESKHARRVLDALGTPDSKRLEEFADLCGSSKLTEDMHRLSVALGEPSKLTEHMQRLIAEGHATAKHIAAANSEPRLKVASLDQPKRRRRPGF